MADEKILSQEEIDALMTGVDGGKIKTDSEQSSEGYRLLDFGNQERIIRGQFPVLERIYDRFQKKLINSVYDFMARDITIERKQMRIEKFQEYAASLRYPSSINIVRFNPLRGKSIFMFDSKFVYSLIETYFGGTGRVEEKVIEREFAISELRVIKSFLSLILVDLKSAWEPVLPVDFEILAREMNPHMANAMSPEDVVLISQFEIKLEDVMGDFHIVIPHSSLEPLRELLDLGSTSSGDEVDPNWSNSIKNEIMDAPVQLSSILSDTELTLREVINLKIGDVIPIEMSEQIILKIEDIPSYRVKYGLSRDKCALKIIGKIKR